MADQFKKFNISTEMYNSATAYAAELGMLRGSIRFGKGNLTGFLGEEALLMLIPESKRINNYDYDFELNGKYIEVKSKQCSTEPLLHYDGSVVYTENPQNADVYVFFRIHKDTRIGWFCGWRSCKSFIKESMLLKSGDKDPANGYVCKRSCWNMPYKDMRDLDSLKLFLGEES